MNHLKLSICIPTYNRLHLIRSSVGAVLKDIEGSDVELIVSDNCSNGCIFETLQDFSGNKHLRIYRNETNIGGNRNIGRLITEYAKGDFVWILGDDDLIIEGAIRRILKVVDDFPRIDYMLANHTYLDIDQRLGKDALTSRDLPTLGKPLFEVGRNGLLDRFEDGFMFTDVPAAMTSLVCHIARREIWKTWDFEGSDSNPFPTWQITFPHLVTVTPKLVGKPIYFHSDPLSILFVGAQEWFSQHWNRILALHVLSFSDFLADLGVESKIVSHYRRCVFYGAANSITTYVNSLTTRKEKLKFVFSLAKSYWREPDFRAWLLQFAYRKLKYLFPHAKPSR